MGNKSTKISVAGATFRAFDMPTDYFQPPDECAICLSTESPVPANNAVIKLRVCNHVFHRHCVVDWVNAQLTMVRFHSDGTCPLCREVLAENPREEEKKPRRVARMPPPTLDIPPSPPDPVDVFKTTFLIQSKARLVALAQKKLEIDAELGRAGFTERHRGELENTLSGIETMEQDERKTLNFLTERIDLAGRLAFSLRE